MKSFDDFQIGELLIERAICRQMEEAEAYIEEIQATHIRVFNEEVENMRILHSHGIGLRAMLAERQGYSFVSSLLPDHLEDLVEQVVHETSIASPDPHRRLPEVVLTDELPVHCAPSMAETPTSYKVELALETERAVRQAHPTIVSTEDVEYIDFDRSVTIVSNKGMRRQMRQSLAILSATAISAGNNGECQSGTMSSYARIFADLSPWEIGKCAAMRAVRLTNARPISTTQISVILDPLIAAQFVDLLAPSIGADAVRKGRSYLEGMIGESIASQALTVIDDGGSFLSPFAAPFDAEGVPTQKTTVIRAGELETFLYDTYNARALKAQSTGNAFRSTFSEPPTLSKSNLYIQPGNWQPEDIIRATQRGLYVQEVQGMHLADPVSGNFSVGVTGGWIEDGEWKHAVRGVTIAGNLFALLKEVDAVGNDFQFRVSPRLTTTCSGSPTLRIASLVISGS